MITLYHINSFKLLIISTLKSPLITTLLFIGYALYALYFTRGRWRRYNIYVKALVAFIPIFFILFFPIIISGNSLTTSYGMWVNEKEGMIEFRVVGGSATLPLCDSNINFTNLSDFKGKVGLRILGLYDFSTNYYIGKFKVGRYIGYLLIEGSPKIIVAYYPKTHTLIALGTPNINNIYNKLLLLRENYCGSGR